ncbi:TRAP transporter permease [Clostridium formicaceticum]|uniref:C4-dicarboxylate ABC transporter n=1 Tax=Clostridium formicaceticum TaxID=1497 RepID=A0AAC9WFI1_9CLOT|nr:TRAP transporter permease [Clostridium formicaceticum]AOY76539.1 C4-dicarboxylate ABC transporter [Clostridium formicaceticum]ARE86952.1 DctM-like transporter [Clostridium formicaceticum]
MPKPLNTKTDPKIKEEEESPKRELTGIYKRTIATIATVMSIFHIYYVGIRPLSPWILYSTHLCFAAVLIFALYPMTKKSAQDRIPWYDMIFIAVNILSTGYIIMNMNQLIYRIGISPTTLDIIVGLIMIFSVLEITRRTTGFILPAIGVLFILYASFGKHIPGILGHRGYSWPKIISYMTGLDAIYSTPIGASATFVFLFIVFSAFLHASGAGKFFIDFALGLTGSTRGGPAKTAVVASSLFGTVSGNSTANVVSTGAFTIPLMKSIGYESKFAGAVEAVASTGGQIMPPILGSAAFILAQLVGVPYLRVVTAAVIPSLLYFLTIFIMIDLEAIKLNLTGIPKKELPSLKEVILKRGHLMIPVFVLMYVLVIMKASPIKAALWAIISTIIIAAVNKETRFSLPKILISLEKGALYSLGMISACATAGIVIGVLNLTGSGLKFASAVLALSRGIPILALVFTMVATLILGMGLPTTAAYMICAAVVAPALVQMGFSPISSHMFAFYFACISAITPPVALAAFAAAGVAKAKPMEVAITSCKLGIAAFIVPYMFIYGPALLWEGNSLTIINAGVSATIGSVALACGLQGFLFKLRLTMVKRILLISASLVLIKPGMQTDMIGLVVILIVGVTAYIKNRKTNLEAA